MGNKNSTTKKKKILAATGTSSSIAVGSGIGLMFLGPIGMFFGSILLSSGLSGVIDTAK